MKTYKKELVDKIDDIICDMCYKSCRCGFNFEHMELYAKWGYGSKKDMTKWEAHFCEDCVDKIEKFIKKEGGVISKEGYFLVS